MPVVLTVDGFKFKIYFNDHAPPHVHVEKAENDAKVQLRPVTIIRHRGFNPREQRRIRKIINEHQAKLIAAWDEIQGGK